MSAERSSVDVEVGQVRIRREQAQVRDRIRTYKVHIDGRYRGSLRPTEVRSFEAATGEHSVSVEVDPGWGSPVVAVTVLFGETVNLECGPNGSFSRFMIDSIRGRNQHPYILLHRV